MKPIQMQRVLVVFALLVSPTALAGMADLWIQLGTEVTLPQNEYMFDQISVTTRVYELNNTYLYTYDLTNPLESGLNASWFSVALSSGVDIISIGYDTSATEVVPTLWHEVGDPMSNLDAQFLDPINPGESSTTLFYLSSRGPAMTTASMGGVGSNGSFLVTNTMISPVPEPATLMLLAAGTLFSLRRKKV